MITKRFFKTVILPIISAIVILISAVAINIFRDTAVNAQDLLKDVKPNKATVQALPSDFITAASDFSISLFKQSISSDKNSLISPASVALALGMTVNGADGNTLAEFKELLGGKISSINQLNKYYYTMSSNLQNDKDNKIRLSNSIWYSQDKSLKIAPQFLQTNADYFNAAAYMADFSSKETVKDINKWVKSNTNGMIDKIVDQIDDNSIMFLLNTVLFEAKWNIVYNSDDVQDGIFTLSDGSDSQAKFMYSTENYLKSNAAQGFIKPYKGSKFSFVAMLPNEGISVQDYIKSLNGKDFLDFINSKSDEYVKIGLPKFKYNYGVSLVNPLKQLGLSDAFSSSKANFSKMGTSSVGNIYISNVLHKTFIQVDELGTKAGAVSKVEMRTGSAMLEQKNVILNRPFVFAIIENDTKLPLFMGAMMNPS